MEPIPTNITDLDRKNSGINTIETMGGIILVAGLILAVISFFALGFQRVETGDYFKQVKTVFLWSGAITSVLIGFGSVLGFAVCKVLATIAKALIQIADNTRQKD